MNLMILANLGSSAMALIALAYNIQQARRSSRRFDNVGGLLDGYEEIADVFGDGNPQHSLRNVAVARRLMRANINTNCKLAADLMLTKGPSGLIEFGAYVERRIMNATKAELEPITKETK